MSQCSAKNADSTGWGYLYPCTYKAKMQHEGKGYCGVHDPVKKAAREAERLARWGAKTKADMERGHKLRTWDDLVEALETLLHSLIDMDEAANGPDVTYEIGVATAALDEAKR